jgi:hypothetical protein
VQNEALKIIQIIFMHITPKYPKLWVLEFNTIPNSYSFCLRIPKHILHFFPHFIRKINGLTAAGRASTGECGKRMSSID